MPVESIKKCPFCGGDRITIIMASGKLTRRRRAVCNSCGASSGLFVTKSAAIEAWNARHTKTTPACSNRAIVDDNLQYVVNALVDALLYMEDTVSRCTVSTWFRIRDHVIANAFTAEDASALLKPYMSWRNNPRYLEETSTSTVIEHDETLDDLTKIMRRNGYVLKGTKYQLLHEASPEKEASVGVRKWIKNII